MRLKQIRLSGFKSFVDATTIPFPTDMTAIVGPNGCGKSNVIDAVRWVLGESSARHLRGGAMTDVIFNGSSERSPVSKAMVELLFDNSKQTLGGEFAAYHEIALRREVSRDGQSRYLLNGHVCRKRDITDIFLGTGLGPRSYAIIEQGMISRLIESKPQELRVFIEEAAGVSKYKERRRETEHRLRHTSDNLVRLRDVEQELAQQVEKLSRQAAAARRYRSLRSRHRELKACLVLQQLQEIEQQLSELRQQSEQQQQQQSAFDIQQTSLENQLSLSRNQDHDLQLKISTQQQELASVGRQLAKLEQQQRHHHQLAQQNHSTTKHLNQQILMLQLRQTQLQEDAQQQQLACETSGEQGILKNAQLDELVLLLNEAEQHGQACQANEQDLRQQEHALQLQCRQLQGQLQRQQELLIRHAKQQAQWQQHLQEQTAVDDQAERQLVQRQVVMQRRDQVLTLSIQGLNGQLQAWQNHGQILGETQQALEKQQAIVEARLASIAPLLLRPEGAKQALIDALSVASGWEHAADVVLAEWLQAELSEQPASAAKISLCRSGESKPLVRAKPLQALACLADKLHGLELQYLFADILLVDDLAQAQTWRHLLLPQQSLLTPKGEWIGANWQRLAPISSQLCLLSLHSEQQQLQQQVMAMQVKTSVLDEQQAQCQQQRLRLQQMRYRQQQDQQQGQTLITELRIQQAGLIKQQQQTQQYVKQLQGQLQQLESQQQQDYRQQQQLESELAQVATQLSPLVSQLHLAQQHAEQAKQQRLNLQGQQQQRQSEVHRAQLQLQDMQAKHAAIIQELQHAQQQQLQYQTQLADLPKEEPQQQAELEQQISNLVAQSLAQEQVQTQLYQQQQRNYDSQQQRQSQLKALQQEMKRSQDLHIQIQVQEQGLLSRSGSLQDQLAEQSEKLSNIELSLPEVSLVSNYEQELVQVDKKLQRLGAVNLAAEEEHQDLQLRYSELSGQILDLDQAVSVLSDAIHKIDRQSRAKFRETFDKVNFDLQQLFPKVFGGGKAWLALSDDDLLDAGVTIMAQPPGKKNASIALLSGGEKALTALALVFAIFRLNPAPFCMLDEVDAPLDEVNVGRFADLVHSMSDSVQFIFISHNKVTMEKASQLAGITMQEAGVSRLVAVDIAEAMAMVQ